MHCCPKLTGREAQVLERIVAGRLNKQIADDLGISIKTVEAHRANIMEKLNANTVADLLKIALGLRSPPPRHDAIVLIAAYARHACVSGRFCLEALETSMTAQLIDGTALSRKHPRRRGRARRALRARGVAPGLAVVLVGEDPASQVYVRNKVRPAKTACIRCSSATRPT